MNEETVYLGTRGPGKTDVVRKEFERRVSDSKVHRIIDVAKRKARRQTPKPDVLTFAIRMSLNYLYGFRPYY